MRKRIFLAIMMLVCAVSIALASGQVNSQVVVTPTGKKYHRPDCRTLHQEMRWLSVEQAKAEGYQPCKVCRP